MADAQESGVFSLSLLAWSLFFWVSFFLVYAFGTWAVCFYINDRIHWFEIHDIDACPPFFKRVARMWIATLWNAFYVLPGSMATNTGEVLFDVMSESGWSGPKSKLSSLLLLDMAAGSGGPNIGVHRALKSKLMAESGENNQSKLHLVTALTDIFPVTASWRQLAKQHSDLDITYCDEPVNALQISNVELLQKMHDFNMDDNNTHSKKSKDDSKQLTIRTIYGSFHHFHPDQTLSLLSDALQNGHGFCMVEPTINRDSLFYFIFLVIATFASAPFVWIRFCYEFMNDEVE